MHPDLEATVAADEECRSRVRLAEEHRERDLSAARAQRDAALAKRAGAAREALDRELQAIHSEGEARFRELREKQERYLASLAEAGERKLAEAAEVYLRIVCTPEERAQ
jgi:hypothetical protein